MDKLEEKMALLERYRKDTLLETLDIRFTHLTENELEATMPVNAKVHQPAGYLHGGASIALAETLGSYLSMTQVDPEKFIVFGLEVSANHIKAKKSGMVTAKAVLRHKGRTTHLVQIDIVDEENKLISTVKMTNIIMPKIGK